MENLDCAPILTIAVPCFNVQDYLAHGLQTLNDSRFKDKLEVLIVNDGSTDSTQQIAESFCDQNPKIFRLINKANGGHGSVINTAIKEARGKYFRIMDGDDWVDTDALNDFLGLLQLVDVDIVVDRRVDVDMSTDAHTAQIPKIRFDYGEMMPFDEICIDINASDVISIHTISVKTQLLREQKVQLLENTFYEDYEYIVKATLHAKTIMYADYCIYHYLLGNASQSVSDANYAKRWDDHSRVTEEVLRYCSEQMNDISPNRQSYLRRKANLLVNTHYNIALIFDPERKRGLKRAKEFRKWLKSNYPDYAANGEKRYRMAKVLHHMGINSQDKLNALNRKRK